MARLFACRALLSGALLVYMDSVSERVLHPLPQWGGGAASGAITFRSSRDMRWGWRLVTAVITNEQDREHYAARNS